MSLKDRSIAISGCIQHAWWAHRLAQHGEYRADRLRFAADSIFCTDPDNALGVFGNLDNLKTGLEIAATLFSRDHNGKNKQIGIQESSLITGYCGHLLRLGTVITRDVGIQRNLAKGIDQVKTDFPHSDVPDENNGDTLEIEEISGRLAELYLQNISPLSPRIMIQGNGIYLRNELFAAGIRTHLMAAVRAAVLWRQCGGRLWLLMFQRNAYLREISRLSSDKSL